MPMMSQLKSLNKYKGQQRKQIDENNEMLAGLAIVSPRRWGNIFPSASPLMCAPLCVGYNLNKW